MKKQLSARQLVLAAVFAAVLAVLSQIAVPLPSGIPITLQTFAVALCGFALGRRLGVLSVSVYLLLGAVGVPVFAGFRGGAGIVFGVTGGFLIGFLPMAALCGTRKVSLGILGLVLCHALGVAQFSIVASIPVTQAFATASLPFLIKDIASVALAPLAARAVRRGLAVARFSFE